MRIER